MSGHDKPELDEATGVHTTGHVWDGDLKELNKPLPKWWLYSFYACIVWAVGYWIFYPAWPTLNGYTPGILGYSQRAAVMQQVDEGRQAQAIYRQKLGETELAEVRNDAELFRFATAGGKAAFANNCAQCHGTGAQGKIGYPNLNDDDWIWGGDIEAIHQTIQHGIRWTQNDETRISAMPAFGVDEILEPAQISDAAEYVLSLSGQSTDAEAVTRGAVVWEENACAGCHGDEGKGLVELGAPNLADAIWLYGGTKESVEKSIYTGRGGAMPSFGNRLDPVTVKSLAVYVHSLGGGQ